MPRIQANAVDLVTQICRPWWVNASCVVGPMRDGRMFAAGFIGVALEASFDATEIESATADCITTVGKGGAVAGFVVYWRRDYRWIDWRMSGKFVDLDGCARLSEVVNGKKTDKSSAQGAQSPDSDGEMESEVPASAFQ